MDLTKFLEANSSVTSTSSAGSGIAENLRNPCENDGTGASKREAMYKTRGVRDDRKTTAAKTLARRKDKRGEAANKRRGVVINQELSDEDEENFAMNAPRAVSTAKKVERKTEKPKNSQKVLERQRQLEEYRLKKQQERLAKQTAKRKPFLVGKVHHAAYNEKIAEVPGFNFANRKTPSRGRVFKFTGASKNGGVSGSIVSLTGGITRSRAAKMATTEASDKKVNKRLGWGKTPSPVKQTTEEVVAEMDDVGQGTNVMKEIAAEEGETVEQEEPKRLGWGKTPESSPKDKFVTPLPRKAMSRITTPFPKGKLPMENEDDDLEEQRDQLMPITPLSSVKKSVRRTPRLGEVAKLYGRIRPEVCFERGSFSERRKKERKSLNQSTSEVKSLDDEIEEIVGSIQKLESAKKIANSSPTGLYLGSNSDREPEDVKFAPKTLEFEEEAVPAINVQPASEEKLTIKDQEVARHKKLLAEAIERLTVHSTKWESKLASLSVDEDISGQIRSAIGKATILMNKKGRFEQFRQIIENCEFELGEKVTKPSDLAGFWDMTFFQVLDVDKEFDKLVILEKNDWKPVQAPERKVSKIIKKKVSVNRKPSAASNKLKELMAAKRKEMSGAKKLAPAKEDCVFEGGFFKVSSPAKALTPRRLSAVTPQCLPVAAPKRLSVATTPARLTPQGTPRGTPRSSNPTTPLLIMSVTKAARRSVYMTTQTEQKASNEQADEQHTTPVKFSAMASCTLGRYETCLSPFEVLPPRKNGGKKSTRKSVRKTDLIKFDSPERVRRSARLSGVKLDYKV